MTSDWSDACDPVPVNRNRRKQLREIMMVSRHSIGSKRPTGKAPALFPYEDSVGHQNYQRMADAAANKRREAKLRDALAVDFSKPYGKGA